MRRYLETLFRRKGLFLTPIVVVPLLAVILTIYTGKKYEVRGSVWVEPTSILEARSLPAATANQVEAQAIRDRLKTDSFRLKVMERTGLAAAIAAGKWPQPSRLQIQLSGNAALRPIAKVLGMVPPANVDEAMNVGLGVVGDSIKVSVQGTNLVVLTYAGSEPELGQRIIEETMSLHNELSLDIRTQEAAFGEELLAGQLSARQENLDSISKQLQLFHELFPPPLPGQTRPPDEESELTLLTRSYNTEQALYEATLKRLDDIRLEGEAQIATRNVSFKIIDPPLAPEVPGIKPKQLILMSVMGLVLGIMLGVVSIVFITWQDATVRTRDDLQKVAKAHMVVELPRLPGSGNKGMRLLQRLAMAWSPGARHDS